MYSRRVRLLCSSRSVAGECRGRACPRHPARRFAADGHIGAVLLCPCPIIPFSEPESPCPRILRRLSGFRNYRTRPCLGRRALLRSQNSYNRSGLSVLQPAGSSRPCPGWYATCLPGAEVLPCCPLPSAKGRRGRRRKDLLPGSNRSLPPLSPQTVFPANIVGFRPDGPWQPYPIAGGRSSARAVLPAYRHEPNIRSYSGRL